MNKKKIYRLTFLLVLLAVLCVLLWELVFPERGMQVQAQVIGMEAVPSLAAFERITGPRELVFPRDQGSHPDFQTEWWYYTGNLQTAEGRRFGYQLTFFRRAVQPAAERADRSSDWAAEQIYMAHFALTDADGRAFYAFERFERGAAGLAGAQGEPNYQVWLRDWQVVQTSDRSYRLHAAQGDISIDLDLTDQKGIILQGDRGYSQKGPEPGNASLYYSQTRLVSQGMVTIGQRSYPVSGLSWLDREISTSVLSAGQIGWDWFALQLSDGSELMAYVLRRADSSIDPFSGGTIVFSDGETERLTHEAFTVSATSTWRSPRSGAVYPAGWTISVPGRDLILRVTPLLPDQELALSFTYWEGAVEVSGTQAGQQVTGRGYVELTGYAESLEAGL